MADTPSLWTIDDVVTHVYGVGAQLGHDLQLGDEGSDAEVEFDAHLQQLRAQGHVSPAAKVDNLNAFAVMVRFCKQHLSSMSMSMHWRVQ